jgi:molybdate transport system substrate-binding protein
MLDVVDRLGLEYERVERSTRLVTSFDASSALRAQIAQGAPADLFLSADTRNPELLADAALASRPVAFARNGLTIVVPVRNEAAIATPFDLARDGVRIVAAGDEVPISWYASELVARLAALPGAPLRFADAVSSNVVSREDNVRSVLAKIELGEADAAIVYATDARASDDVAQIPVPVAAAVSATYAAVTIRGSRAEAAAGRFLEWLLGAEAQRVLQSAGFLPPEP